MSQQLLTKYYKSGKGNGSEMEKTLYKKHNLSLRKSITPFKRKVESEEIETVVIITSDEEAENKEWLLNNGPQSLSQSSVDSETSDKTIIYSPETFIKQETPVKQTDSKQSTSSPMSKTPYITPTTKPKSIQTSSSGTSIEGAPSQSRKSKFYSPNKKRKVTLRSPGKSPISPCYPLAKRLFPSAEDETYESACEGVDDKTKFLLKIINDFLKQDSMKRLLDDQSVSLISNFFTLPKTGMKLICRLFWRKDGWYKKDVVRNICAEEKGESVDEETAAHMLEVLVAQNFLLAGTKDNMDFHEFTSILKADELIAICKDLKLKSQTKKTAVEALQQFSSRKSICTYFTPNNHSAGQGNNNSTRVLQIMCQKVGACYRLSDLARGTLERLYILTYLGIDYDIIREKRLEFMLINEKIQRETFPINRDMQIDNACAVFDSREEFERYFLAHCIYEDFLSRTKTDERCAIVRQVHDLYKNLDVEHLIRYKSLQPWLQRYTPANIYIKILDMGLTELKKGRDGTNCRIAVEILTTLLEQTFRQHKRAEWYAEKALLLHTYLSEPYCAAQVLIEGFESDLTEVAKDCMRPRAKKIAQQKNIELDDVIRQTLLAFASKETLLEGSIPSHHIYKQPMDNPTKGKAMYETKSEFGRTTQGVEEYALSCYILTGEYNQGDHWEGRILNTIFFLLFWDIIYTKPKNVRGVFLSYYQKHPLDLFCKEFYTNRREAIETRLKFIEESSMSQVLDFMQRVWDGRPESELSPISRDIGWPRLAAVTSCLPPPRLACLVRRLATDYHYCRSGFPDLTLWNDSTKQIKFVEVKSDSDKPSIKQIQWMQYLLQNGIETEFCYVGANTTRPKSRKSCKPECYGSL